MALHTVSAAYNKHCKIKHLQGTLSFRRKINVTRCVKQGERCVFISNSAGFEKTVIPLFFQSYPCQEKRRRGLHVRPFLFCPTNKALLPKALSCLSRRGRLCLLLFFHIFFLFAKFQCTPFHSSFAQIQTFHIKTCPFLRYKGFVYMLSSCYLIINHFQESFVFYH